MSGSHRTTIHSREPERRVGLVLAGVVAGVVVCILAAVVVLTSIRGGPSTELAGGSTVESSPITPQELNAVPDVCSVVPQEITEELAPGAHVTQNDPFESDDRVSQCTWGTYGTDARQLTVQLRAIESQAGESGSTIAAKQLQSERRADEAGQGLRRDQRVIRKEDVQGIGDEGYAVYSRVVAKGDGHGEGIVSVRSGNIMITVHYAGSNGEAAKPLAAAAALDGATRVAQETVKRL